MMRCTAVVFLSCVLVTATGCQMFGFDEEASSSDGGVIEDGGSGGGDGDAAGDGDATGDGDGDATGDGDGDATSDCDDPDGDGYGVGTTCLGDDCNEDDANIYVGAPERCNGVDDDCDDATDEGADAACYGGREGTQGVGACQAGVSYCLDGAAGPCIGEVIPGAEACNLVDDDCDGAVDDGLTPLSCGIGECANTVASCDSSGNLQQCVPGNPGSEQGNCADGLDNDCNGLVDDCSCVHVATFGDDVNGDGSAASPLRTIAEGISFAQQPGQPPRVCLGADNNGSCQWTFYAEDVSMVDGIGVSGGWDTGSNAWVRRPLHGNNLDCVTEIQGQTQGVAAVTFGHGVASSTPLDNTVVSLQNAGTNAVTVLIEGSTGALITGSSVVGAAAGASTTGVLITNDPVGGTASTPIITYSSVTGGAGTTGTAIHSVRSSPVIQGNCGANRILQNGRCFQGCNELSIRANRFTGSGVQVPTDATAILLEDSPGAVVDQNVVCGGGSGEVAGVRIIGEGKRTVISRNDIVVWGGLNNNGVHMPGCRGEAPWLVDNERIAAEGNYPLGTAIAAAVRASGDCHPLVEGNGLIVGGVEGAVMETYGVHCGADPVSGTPSRCSVIGNTEIRGSNSNVPTLSIGMRCENGACNVIQDNALITGRAGVDVAGLQLVGATGAFVDGNVIHGGCGVTSSIGVLADDAAARIQNNVIEAGSCNGAPPSSQWYGVRAVLRAGVNELDIHSNSILGGGSPGVACTSRALNLDVDPAAAPSRGLGVVRNNILDAGVCNMRYGVVEADAAADPRVFEHNDLWPAAATALYLDEGATVLATGAAVDGLGDMQVTQTLDVDPQWTRDPLNGLYRLDPASMCRDTGTASGAPGDDFEGQPRPSGAAHDIGADEVQ